MLCEIYVDRYMAVSIYGSGVEGREVQKAKIQMLKVVIFSGIMNKLQ